MKKMKPTVDSMPEALVTLQLAFWLLDRADPNSHVDLAIDGAHVRIAAHEQAGRQIEARQVFAIEEFLNRSGCQSKSPSGHWRGTYQRKDCSFRIQSARGFDICGTLNGKAIKVECKGGPLEPVAGRGVSDIYAKAIGQVIVTGADDPADELWVAVPDSPTFETVGTRIARARTFSATGIRIALVGKDGNVRLLNGSKEP
jgi:hypothetical protein